jgi:hypothetical protein
VSCFVKIGSVDLSVYVYSILVDTLSYDVVSHCFHKDLVVEANDVFFSLSLWINQDFHVELF